MKLRDYRAAVVDAIAERVPALRDVKAHPGRFTQTELERYSVNAPAARVAVVGMKRVKVDSAGRVFGPWMVMVFLITSGAEADAQMLDVVEQVSDAINLDRLGVDQASAATIERIDNLYSAETSGGGVQLWAITFEQEVAFTRDLASAELLSDMTLSDVLAAPDELSANWNDDQEILIGEGVE